ncbi:MULTISPECIES: terminase small subunit [unclassified Acinetobacter]|uniref:terminase small subunit n=1 Tax=unclassified Acinetobacter TaxID=196816 RepID=UPI0029345632|nr:MULTISPECIES: terminase small subunit [unclassified Acinetobacter]WOE32760.1 terminase small subunit [Acinetobacter sp. SAAs470]WOE38237.1 terminase small subunit [Acinetobacter sp. SAAs474]
MTKHAGADSLKDDRHELFCQEYLKDLNITQAGIRAGYSTKSAKQHCSKLFAKPEIQERIAYLKEIRMNELGLDAYYVLKNLKSIAERCMQAEAVTDREGNPVYIEGPDGQIQPAYVFKEQGATKANELIGKHIGMFVEKKKINVEVDLMSELIDELSEE